MSEEHPIRSKAALLEAIKHGHDQFVAAIFGLGEEQMTTPGAQSDSVWTVKDVLAHLARWMRAMVVRLPGGAGKPFPFEIEDGEARDSYTNRINDYWYQRDKDLPLAEVRSEFEAAYQQLAEAVSALSDAHVAERAIQYRIEGNSFGHFDEHLDYMADWLKQQQAQA